MAQVRVSPSGAFQEISGGGGDPLSNAFYLDLGTATPPADQDGFIGAPFGSAQDAVDAAANGDSILLTPGDYGLFSIDTKDLVFIGQGARGATAPITLPLVSVTDSSVWFENMAVAFDCTENLSSCALEFVNCQLGGTFGGIASTLSARGCVCTGTIDGAAAATFYDTSINILVNCVDVVTDGCEFAADITCLNLRVTNASRCYATTLTVDTLTIDGISYAMMVDAGVTFNVNNLIIIGEIPTGAGPFTFYFGGAGQPSGLSFLGAWTGNGLTATENFAKLQLTHPGTFRNLRVVCRQGVISNAAVDFTVRINGANTGITCNIAPGGSTGNDLVNTAAAVAGDDVSLGANGGVNANMPTVWAAVDYYPS